MGRFLKHAGVGSGQAPEGIQENRRCGPGLECRKGLGPGPVAENAQAPVDRRQGELSGEVPAAAG